MNKYLDFFIIKTCHLEKNLANLPKKQANNLWQGFCNFFCGKKNFQDGKFYNKLKKKNLKKFKYLFIRKC